MNTIIFSLPYHMKNYNRGLGVRGDARWKERYQCPALDKGHGLRRAASRIALPPPSPSSPLLPLASPYPPSPHKLSVTWCREEEPPSPGLPTSPSHGPWTRCCLPSDPLLEHRSVVRPGAAEGLDLPVGVIASEALDCVLAMA